MAQLRRDYKTASISPEERAMLDYAVLITRDATQSSPETMNDLRNAGFSDQAILQITLIAAFFNYINRVADALGVGREAAK